MTYGRAQSSVKIAAAADIKDVNVVLQVHHPDVAALEVVLTATSSSKLNKAVSLKAPLYGVVGGADMIQTIFSDFAPSEFPRDASAAPYSSVYRPAQPLKLLSAGSNTTAGFGGSQGVWTLTIADKAEGDHSRRPLKIIGWELWLCGESSGPLFAPEPLNATAFDQTSSNASVNIVKKAVVTPKDTDVDVIVRGGYRKKTVEQDPVNAALTNLNKFLAKGIAQKVDGVVAGVKQTNPQLADFLKKAMDRSAEKLRGLPGIMGYQQGDDGQWVLPSSEVVITGLLQTIQHCYYDLHWCWQNTGLRGSFALDFVNEWNARAGPVAAGWAAAQEEWIGAVARFEEAFPGINQWGDVLFYSVIDTLYDAAAVDAVFSVGEAWADTAIRLAIYASPIRFAVNPRAFVTQTLSGVTDILRTVFDALKYVPFLIDDDNNNDVAAITAAAQALIDATTRAVTMAIDGLNLRAQGMENRLTQGAGGLARSAASLNDKIVDSLRGVSPELADMFHAASSPMAQVLSSTADMTQRQVATFFRQQNIRQPMQQQLKETVKLLGDNALQLTSNAATVLVKAAQKIDDSIPGPSLHSLLVDVKTEVDGILSDAREAFEKVLPLPEIAEAQDLIGHTLGSVLDMFQDTIGKVQGSEAGQAVRDQMLALAAQLQGAQDDVASVVNGIVDKFPGPLLNQTLGIIRRQVEMTANDIQSLFDELVFKYPDINPATFLNQLRNLLEELLGSTTDSVSAFVGLAPPQSRAPEDLLSQVPELLVAGVSKAIPQLQDTLDGLLPKSVTQGSSPLADLTGQASDVVQNTLNNLNSIQQGVGNIMQQFAGRVNSLADSIPTSPPAVADIASNIAERSQSLRQSASQLLPALQDAVSAPSQVAQAGLADLNNGLQNLLEDLRGQQDRAEEIAQQIADGPLPGVLQGLNATVANVLGPVQGVLESLQKQLPNLPGLRQILDATLGPVMSNLDLAVDQASKAGLQALDLASKGMMDGLAGGLDTLAKLLDDAQWQLAGLLSAAVKAGEQLDALASGAAPELESKLLAVQQNLADVAGNITQGLVNQLSAAAPPVDVIKNIVDPIAAALNTQMGSISQALKPDGIMQALGGALQQLDGLPSVLVGAAGTALGLPELPTTLLSSLGGIGKPGNATVVVGGQGHHLLAASSSPVTGFALQLPVVGSLKDAGFDTDAFVLDLAQLLQQGVADFADQMVQQVQSLQNSPASQQVRSAIADIGSSVRQAANELTAAASLLPQGPVLRALLTPDTSFMEGLGNAVAQLSQGQVGNGQVLQAIVTSLGGLTAVEANSGMMPSGAAALGQLLQQFVHSGAGSWLGH
eukprot:gene12807-12935_t